ncbi:hypothetical protein JOD67_003237 [Tenggerimyces flavus]|nr:hypothetical protein [Tenggerimyces flavus]
MTEGHAHEGSPAYHVAGRQFVRLRWEGDREILQFWAPDPGAREALVRTEPDKFSISRAFPAAVFAWLDQLSMAEVTEVVADSWTAKAPNAYPNPRCQRSP